MKMSGLAKKSFYTSVKLFTFEKRRSSYENLHKNRR